MLYNFTLEFVQIINETDLDLINYNTFHIYLSKQIRGKSVLLNRTYTIIAVIIISTFYIIGIEFNQVLSTWKDDS